MLDLQDKKLVIRLKLNDGAAFEKLFLKYNRRLYMYCYRMVNNSMEAEEVTQSTFIKIWETRQNIDENRSFSGYIFKIAYNKIYNLIRKKINERYYKEYLEEYAETIENSTESHINFKELEDLLEYLTAKLPDKRKTIFLLSRREGLTYKEIARKLNISENTVDTQIRKVLDFFRQALRERFLTIIRIFIISIFRFFI